MPSLRTSAYVEQHIDGRRNGEASARSLRYRLDNFVETIGDPAPADITAQACDEWWRSTSELAVSTRRAHYSSVRCFLRWLAAMGVMVGDPLRAVTPPKEPRRSPRTLGRADVDALWRQVGDDLRLGAVLALMYGLGLRCVDVSNLDTGDVDWHAGLITVRGKGGNEDVLPLPTLVADRLTEYLRAHPAPAGPLIRDARAHRRRVTAAHLSELIAEMSAAAGVKGSPFDGAGAHALRRTFGTELLEAGANIRQVQALLRHESLASTERYLRRSTAADLRGLVDARVLR